jgi:hypothetical protein
MASVAQTTTFHLQQQDGVRGIDVSGSTTHEGGIAGLTQHSIKPQVIVKADTHDDSGFAKSVEILGARRIVFCVAAGWCQRYHTDAIAANGFDQTLQVCGGRYNRQSRLGPRGQLQQETQAQKTDGKPSVVRH